MKKSFMLFLAAVAIPALAAMDIQTEVAGVIGGYIDHLDYHTTVDDRPQEFTVNWINSGSVGCRVRFRIDVSRGNQTVYTAWSTEEPIDAGGNNEFRIYWQPNESGEYTGRMRMYYCKTVEEGPEINFTTKISAREKGDPFNVTLENDREKIKVKIKSDVELDRIIVTPEAYPLGWIVESGETSLKETGENTAEVGYLPEIWRPAEVSLLVTTPDGKYAKKITYMVGQNAILDVKKLAIYALSLTVAALAAALVFLYSRYSKISQRPGKKRAIKSKT